MSPHHLFLGLPVDLRPFGDLSLAILVILSIWLFYSFFFKTARRVGRRGGPTEKTGKSVGRARWWICLKGNARMSKRILLNEYKSVLGLESKWRVLVG
jgi:hypothetical protein